MCVIPVAYIISAWITTLYEYVKYRIIDITYIIYNFEENLTLYDDCVIKKRTIIYFELRTKYFWYNHMLDLPLKQ